MIFIVLLVIIGLWLVTRTFLIPIISPMPENLGITDGNLAPCPATPNCVSSQVDESDTSHYIAPLPIRLSIEETHDKLITVLNDLARTTIKTDTPTYIHAINRTFAMGYIDDIEFYIDEANGVVHVRSAARLGASDLGVNRNRIETIRKNYLQASQ